MNDSSKTFVQSLRDKLSGTSNEPEVKVTGIEVEEHKFEDLDEHTQTTVLNMFETMRLRKLSETQRLKVRGDAFNTVRTRTLGSL